MPIRTPHGRSAAYRGIWGWPLRSPARLAVTIGAVVVVAVAVSIGVNTLNPPPAPAPASPGSAAATPTPYVPPSGGPAPTPVPTVLPPVPPLTPSNLPISAAPAAALDVATRWTQAWVRPPDGTPAQTWINNLRPLTTEEYLGVLTSVDPSNIAATRVTGPARAVSVAPQSVRVQVPTDAFTLVVVVVDDGSAGWRVADYSEA